MRSTIGLTFALKAGYPFLIDFIALLLEIRRIDFLTLIILNTEKLDDGTDHAAWVGCQILINHDKWVDLIALEPLGPIAVLPFDKAKAPRERWPIVLHMLSVRFLVVD